LGGRGVAWLANWAKRVQGSAHVALRIGIAGAVLAGLAVATHAAFDAPLSLGAGYEAIDWVRDPTRSLQLVALLLVVRVVATITTVAGGGVGGLFIPLVVQGALLGRLVGGLVGEPNAELYPIVGLAAFLAAGYRTPIAAVMFVAESSFGESYIIPALVAAAVSQIVVGRATVSGYQRSVRQGHLERRLDLTISAALSTDVLTVPPDASVAELVDVHVLGNRQRVVPVVDGSAYLGMVGLPKIGSLPRDEWAAVNVGKVLDADVPVAKPSWTLRAATAAMEASGVDLLAVVDADDRFVGVVSASEIVKLDEILDETGG
jgi:CIC family chloride channel protein